MLGASQVVVVGYVFDGFMLCRRCAEKREEQGTNIHGQDVTPFIQYSADEWASEEAYQRYESDPQHESEEVQEYDYPTCDQCGQAIGN